MSTTELEVVAAPSNDDPPPSPRTGPRRWRRRLLILALVLVTLGAVAWFARIPLAEKILQGALPGQLESTIGMATQVSGLTLRKHHDSGQLHLVVAELRLESTAGVLHGRNLSVTLQGLGAAIDDALASVRDVRVAELTWQAAPDAPSTLPRVPEVRMPAALPTIEFPVHIDRWEFHDAHRHAQGSLALVAGNLDVSGTVMTGAPDAAKVASAAKAADAREAGNPPHDSAREWPLSAGARLSPSAIEQIHIDATPLTLTGSLRRHDDLWRGQLSATTPQGTAEALFDLPTSDQQETRGTITMTPPPTAPDGSPTASIQGTFDFTALAPTARLQGVVTTAAGNLAVTASVDAEAIQVRGDLVKFDPGPLLGAWLPAGYALEAPLDGELTWRLLQAQPPGSGAGTIPSIQARLRGAAPGRITAPGVDEAFHDLHIEGSFTTVATPAATDSSNSAVGQPTDWMPVEAIRVEAFRLTALNGEARIGGSVLPTADGSKQQVIATAAFGEGSFGVRGTLQQTTLDLHVDCRELDIGAAARHFAPKSPWNGVFNGTGTLTGTIAAPLFSGSLTSKRGSLALAGQELGYADLRAAAKYRDSSFDSDVSVRVLDGTLTAKGAIPIAAKQRWDADLTFADIDVAGVRPWTTIFRDLQGRIGGNARVRGPMEQPTVVADCTLSGGEIAFEGWERLRNLSADLSYAAGEVRFANVTGEAGGGTLSGSGSWTTTTALPELTAQLTVDRVVLVRSPDLAMRVSGNLSLEGNSEDSTLTGDLEVVRGIYRRNYYPQLRGGAATSFDLFSLGGFFANTRWDVPLHMRGGFRIENNRARVTPRGTVRLRGTGAVPFLVGSIAATSGQVLLPHLKIQIGFAEFEFPEDDPYRPRLQFQGSGSIRDHEISVAADGPLDDIEVEFRSQPELPEEELVVLVATGRFPTDFAQGGAETTAVTELALLYGPQVWEWLFGQGESSILDDITISTEAAETEDGSDRITVEWRVRDGVSVVGEQDNRGDMNVDLRFFWWFR